MWDKVNDEQSQQSFSNEGSKNTNNDNEKDYDSILDELSLEYLPNELRYTQKYHNPEAEMILNGNSNLNKTMLVEFFRGITLCHQINVTKDMKLSQREMYQYVGVFNDEIASLDFANQQNFKLVQRSKKMLTIILQG